MTARRTVQFTLCALFVAGALTSSACASTRTINQLLADPSRYRNDTVQLSGEVIDSYSLADRGAYQIDDGTGRLWVVSEHGVPRKSARVICIHIGEQINAGRGKTPGCGERPLIALVVESPLRMPCEEPQGYRSA